MTTWNEADHPRDDIGRFTDKYGSNSGSNGIIEGGVEKTVGRDGGDWGDGEGVGDVLGSIFGTILNPQTISAILNILALKYNVKEMKKIKEELYEYMEKHSNSEQESQELQDAKMEKMKQEILSKQEESDRKLQNRLDILYPTMREQKESFTGDAAPLQGSVEMQEQQKHKLYNEIAVDHMDNKHIKKYVYDNYGLETAENLIMSKKDSYLNTPYAKEHLIFKNYTELSTDLKDYFEKKITSQIGADKLKTTGGIYINAQHYSSKELAKVLVDNKEFRQIVTQARKLLDAGRTFNTSIEFTDKNFHNALGKADILDMHINKNGEIDLLVTDVYDFNKNSKNDLVQVGRDRQDKGEIKPYFIIYHVIIPKSAKLGESGR